MEKQAGDGC